MPTPAALLCCGKLTGVKLDSTSDVYIRRGEILQCPVHTWEFGVRTGCSLHLWPPLRTDTYPVRIEDGRIYVSRA